MVTVSTMMAVVGYAKSRMGGDVLKYQIEFQIAPGSLQFVAMDFKKSGNNAMMVIEEMVTAVISSAENKILPYCAPMGLLIPENNVMMGIVHPMTVVAPLAGFSLAGTVTISPPDVGDYLRNVVMEC